MANKDFTTIKTRFGDLKLVGSDTVIQITVDGTTPESPTSITATTPLIVRIEQTTDKTRITSTNITLKDVIDTFIDKNAKNGIILNNSNKLVFNANNLELPLATTQLIGGVKDSDTTLMNFIHVHQNGNYKGQMEINSLDVQKLQQTNWLILDSEDADGEFTATTEAK